jgi:hypothetical protein
VIAMKNPHRWPIIVAYMTSTVFGIGAIQYANYVDSQSNQQWCQLLNVLDSAYTSQPPRTPTGKVVAMKIHELRSDFDC